MAKQKYKINAKYQNSRPVNYNRWSEHKEVIALVNEIMSGFSGSQKISGYQSNMRVLVLDLFESCVTDPQQYIGCHRGNDHFKFKLKGKNTDRYVKNPLITAAYFVGVINYLATNGYVDYEPGGHFVDERGNEYGFLSRIRPTAKFADICTKYKLTLEMVGQFSEDELIVLKSAKVKIKNPKTGKLVLDPKSGKPIGYDDTPETESMRNAVKAYNRLMDYTYVDIDIECLSYADRNMLTENMTDYEVENPEIILRLANRNVYRVFNNADTSFRQGGRFYGSWWIGCPSILRKYITIDGSPTVELDYSGIHIHLAYALEGINYAALKQKPYELVDNDPDKELNKLIMLTAINAKNDHLTASAVFDELREDGKLQAYKITSHEPIATKLQLLKLKHNPIRDYIASSKGIYLQYYDSVVMEQLINYFTSRNIPILTIHDSVICKQEHQSAVREQMHKLFANMINTHIKTDRTNIPDGKIRKTLNVKYQKTYDNKPNWQHLASIFSRYKAPGIIVIKEMAYKLIVNRSMIEYFLRVDDLITIIPSDIRSNTCNTKCKTYNRYLNYLQIKKPYRGTVKIKLIKNIPNYIEISN